jgi:Spy/CpxP family protein refolding chaperone
MRSKILWILLAASLALNVFFVGLFWPRLMGHDHWRDRPDPVAMAAQDFALNDSQVAALEDLRARIAERREERNGDRGSFRSLIIEALRQPAFDRAALDQALDARRASGGDMVLDMAEDLHGFLAGLSSEQKADFLARAEQDRDFLRRLLFPPRPQMDRGKDRGPD